MPMIEEPPVRPDAITEEENAIFTRVREVVLREEESPAVKKLKEETRGRLRPIPVSWSPSDPSWP